ncbi:MAG: recombinase family protein [Burkholderiales bacterium]
MAKRGGGVKIAEAEGEAMRAAIYTRFSSDRQREASSEDQRRNCERRADAEGWEIVAHYKDEGISGSRSDRPGYQQTLRAAMAGEFDVLLLDDLSRLSRDQVEGESAIRRIEHRGVRVIALSDGYDSQSKSRKMQRGVKGLMNEIFLDDLRDKTHRGLTGQALKGNNCGGRAFGYKHVPVEDPTRRDPFGRPVIVAVRREIDEAQAEVVRRIFGSYAAGASARAIAEALNRDGIASPGSTWNRERPCRGWAATAINGPMAGTGILNNPTYVGTYVWNRAQWVKNPDSGKRERRLRDKAEWVENDMPELRIVPDALWQAVKRRQRERADTVGARVRAGFTERAARRSGPPGKYLFSTLLKCDVCGSSFVMSGATHYACASMVNGRRPFCGNRGRVKRTVVEAALLRDVQTELLAPEVVKAICKEVPKRLAALTKQADVDERRVAEIEAENERLVDSIARMAGSVQLEGRLKRNEAEIARLRSSASAPAVKVGRIIPKLAETYRAVIADLGDVALRDVGRGRADLRRLYGGEIRIRPSADGSCLEAAVPGKDRLVQLAVANGLGFGATTSGVAGTGFEPVTFGL